MAFAAGLDGGLVDASLSQVLASLGLVAAKGQEVAGVLPAQSAADAGLIQRPAGMPMLRLQRVTRTSNNTVLEVVESLLDPARFGLRIYF